MKEEDTLPESPEGRGPKLSRRGLALTNPVGESLPHVVKRKVGVQICRLSAESCDSGSAGLKGWRVAYRAANVDKELVAVCNGSGSARRVLRRRRRRKKAHECGEFFDITQYIQAALVGVRRVVWRRLELTLGILFSLCLEELIRDAHLDIVCLTGKYQKRLVLRLPAKPRDGAVIAVTILASCLRVTRIDDVHPAPDSVGITSRLRKVVQNSLVGNLLDQSRAEHGRWNSEYHVLASQLAGEVGLPQNTAIRACKSRDGKDRMDAAIGGLPVRVQLEPRFAHWAILGNEARQMVGLLQILLEEIELWIEFRRACTTDGRLSVTAGAAIEVHSRPQAVRDLVGTIELIESGVEQAGLGRRQAVQRLTGRSSSRTRPGIVRALRLQADRDDQNRNRHDQRCDHA